MNQLDQVCAVLSRWRPGDAVSALEPLTPDASTRRYYRVRFGSGSPVSAVVMVFESVVSPEYEGASAVPADQAYVELTAFLKRHGVAVPELLLDARPDRMLVLEDLGDQLLAVKVQGSGTSCCERYFEQAVEQIVRLQQIPKDEAFFAYQRYFSARAYYREMREFQDFLLGDDGLPDESKELLDSAMQRLAEDLERQPRVLTHRDFHGWNLVLDANNAVRVIDFQDALMAPAAYDIVGLLNDRDMDALLGRECYGRLLKRFHRSIGGPSGFFELYDLVLLQRDLKVAGRFAKLSGAAGLERYAGWIPGTLRRIGRTLSRLQSREIPYGGFSAVSSELAAAVPEIAGGMREEPWY